MMTLSLVQPLRQPIARPIARPIAKPIILVAVTVSAVLTGIMTESAAFANVAPNALLQPQGLMGQPVISQSLTPSLATEAPNIPGLLGLASFGFSASFLYRRRNLTPKKKRDR